MGEKLLPLQDRILETKDKDGMVWARVTEQSE